jgi:hypothetical protein
LLEIINHKSLCRRIASIYSTKAITPTMGMAPNHTTQKPVVSHLTSMTFTTYRKLYLSNRIILKQVLSSVRTRILNILFSSTTSKSARCLRNSYSNKLSQFKPKYTLSSRTKLHIKQVVSNKFNRNTKIILKTASP